MSLILLISSLFLSRKFSGLISLEVKIVYKTKDMEHNLPMGDFVFMQILKS